MSLLLDALRKSANQRHLGSPPGLEDGLRQQPPNDPTRRSWLAPILMLLIVVAVVAARPWQSFLATEDMPEPSVDELVVEADTAAVQPSEPAVAKSDAVAEAVKPPVAKVQAKPRQVVAAEPEVDYHQEPAEIEPDYADDAAYIAEQLYRAQVDPYDDSVDSEELEVDDQTGRDVLKAILESADNSEEYREFISQIAADERGELETHPDFEELGIQYPQSAGASTQDEAQQLPGIADAEPAPRVLASSTSASGGGVAKTETAESGRSVNPGAKSSKGTPATVADEEQDPDLGVVSYHELPVEVRSSMPAVNIQIRVYDDEPARRFVISGTRRVHEGEALGDGITLHRVRRDGLILVYQSYVFFWDKR